MSVQSTIETRLRTEFEPVFIEVLNESANHNVPPGSESHFRVVLVTARFAGVPRIARQRRVNELLADLLAGPVHALAQQAFTPDEWVARGGTIRESPACHGGSAVASAS